MWIFSPYVVWPTCQVLVSIAFILASLRGYKSDMGLIELVKEQGKGYEKVLSMQTETMDSYRALIDAQHEQIRRLTDALAGNDITAVLGRHPVEEPFDISPGA